MKIPRIELAFSEADLVMFEKHGVDVAHIDRYRRVINRLRKYDAEGKIQFVE